MGGGNYPQCTVQLWGQCVAKQAKVVCIGFGFSVKGSSPRAWRHLLDIQCERVFYRFISTCVETLFVGLTDALAEYFCGVRDCQNLFGESCPGTERCRTTPGKPLNKYGGDEDTVCGGCSLRPSKPETLGERYAAMADEALSLAELNRSGATFAYPNALTSAEWSMIAGVTQPTIIATTCCMARGKASLMRGIPSVSKILPLFIIASQFLLYDCNIFCPKKQLDSLIIFGLKLYNIYS